jgi:hypothetical protein
MSGLSATVFGGLPRTHRFLLASAVEQTALAFFQFNICNHEAGLGRIAPVTEWDRRARDGVAAIQGSSPTPRDAKPVTRGGYING